MTLPAQIHASHLSCLSLQLGLLVYRPLSTLSSMLYLTNQVQQPRVTLYHQRQLKSTSPYVTLHLIPPYPTSLCYYPPAAESLNLVVLITIIPENDFSPHPQIEDDLSNFCT